MYIGAIGDKVIIRAKYVGKFSYQMQLNWLRITRTIYKFEDEQGNAIAWDTTGYVEDKKRVDEYGQPILIPVGSVLDIKCTIKNHREYKDEPQTVIERPSFSIVELSKTQAETEQEKRDAQINSLKEGDRICKMKYKQYKEHYADCETLVGSFDKTQCTIDVIVRDGRMKASGVRGKRFNGYVFTNGKTFAGFTAVSKENAYKRVCKEFPEHSWELYRIY